MTDKIFHIADIHCRNYQRHKEYKAVFKRLYKYIKSHMTENSLIYLAGDIVHSKTDMTPELIDIVSEFLRNCCDLLPTIMITGNHDANLNNESRLDALTPIVKALNHPNMHYWKDNGIYKINPDDNITYSVYSVFNTPDEWIKADEIDTTDIKIALHHGAVNGARTDINYSIENEQVAAGIFKGFDYALLGDIHKYQYLDPSERVCYPGSLIQQNYGEDLVHGIVVWDLIENTKEYVPIKNDYAFVTLDFKDDVLLNSEEYLEYLPKYIRLRIKYENTSRETIDFHVNKLKEKHVFKEYTTQRSNALDFNISNADTKIGDIRDIEYQNSLISEYLKQINVDDSAILDQIRHINRVTNSTINSNRKVVRNVTWKPIKFEFSNMFSYGPNNVIDFEKLKGVQGLFAPNTAGKSTLLDAIAFCLFDKCSRTYKASHVLNNKKTFFKSKLEFEMAGERYVIIRNGKTRKQTKVRVEVDFYKVKDGKKLQDLKGKERSDTNTNIREYIGTYEDFLLTALSTQNDNKNFVFKSQRERKELLYSFLDLSIFTQLFKTVKEKLKEKKAVIKSVTSSINQVKETEMIDEKKELTKKLTLETKSLRQLEAKRDDLSNEISKLTQELVKIPEVRAVQTIETDLTKENTKLAKLVSQVKALKELIGKKENAYAKLQANSPKSPSYLDYDFKTEITKYRQSSSTLQSELNSLQHKLSSAKKKEDMLSTYAYDPDCEYCINNKIVKDAMQEVAQLSNINSSILSIQPKLTDVTSKLVAIERKYAIVVEYNKNVDLLEKAKNSIDSSVNLLNSMKIEFDQIRTKITAYEAEKKSVMQFTQLEESNTQIDSKIAKLREINIEIIRKIDRLVLDTQHTKNKILILDANIDNFNVRKEELYKLEKDEEIYTLYSKAISPSGIPYMLLTKVLPILEIEVNKILNDIVNFTVYIKAEEDTQNILCQLNYSNGNVWPIELASGMEKFITSIAIRSALVDVTSLPRPNFIAIDEGFGVLDPNNISNIYLLFEKIKTKFEFILLVTHLDTLKDIADQTIDITKRNKFSYVNNVG